MSSIRVTAIVIGALIDVAGSILTGILYTVVIAIFLAAEGVPPADMEQRLMQDAGYYLVSVVMGLTFVALGAYVAGRIAGTRELVHAQIVGLIAIVVGVLFLLMPGSATTPVWFTLSSFGLTLPAAALGGYMAQRRNRTLRLFLNRSDDPSRQSR